MIKVLTSEQMREVDRRTIEAGIPGLILMENAACRFVEFLVERYAPLASQRIVVVCGKGNNGGDGLAIARQLFTRFQARSLQVLLACDPAEYAGDAALNRDMFLAVGGVFTAGVPDPRVTLVIDALLGTGLRGAVSGPHLEWIRWMNRAGAKVVAVDTPSGLMHGGEYVRAHQTVTFGAAKTNLVTPPLCDAVGELIVAPIGIPEEILAAASDVGMSELSDFEAILAPRASNSHKGAYGHVLVAGGAQGKTGAAAMAGLAALRAGAGLVTVAASAPVTAYPELMSAPLDAFSLDRISVLAIGPGIGDAQARVRKLVQEADIPVVIDADGLNALAGLTDAPWAEGSKPRILTPHPGEMARLMQVTGDRIADARSLGMHWGCCVVLKGSRTVIAFEDGSVCINPTGSPAMAKAGSGDVLTGVIAGLIAQFPGQWQLAVRCAVYLHGRAGELAAREHGDKGVLATDLLRHLYAGL